MDILMYSDHEAWHAICRGIKWHAGAEVNSKEEDHLIDVLWTVWIGVYGAPEFLYVDGEGGLTTDKL